MREGGLAALVDACQSALKRDRKKCVIVKWEQRQLQPDMPSDERHWRSSR